MLTGSNNGQMPINSPLKSMKNYKKKDEQPWPNNSWFWWILTAIVVVSAVIFLLGRKTRSHVGVRQSGTVMVSVPEAPAEGQTGMVTFTIRPRLGQETNVGDGK